MFNEGDRVIRAPVKDGDQPRVGTITRCYRPALSTNVQGQDDWWLYEVEWDQGWREVGYMSEGLSLVPAADTVMLKVEGLIK